MLMLTRSAKRVAHILIYQENKTIRSVASPCPQNSEFPVLCDCLLSGGWDGPAGSRFVLVDM